MKKAVYQSGYAIFGIGEDLEEAINDANQYLDEPVDIESIETASHGEIYGKMYFASITDELVRDFENWGDVAQYIRLAGENVLVSESEYDLNVEEV